MSCFTQAGITPLKEIAVHCSGHSVQSHNVQHLHYVNPSSSLIAAMQVKKEAGIKLSLHFNQVSLEVVNSITLQASFSV